MDIMDFIVTNVANNTGKDRKEIEDFVLKTVSKLPAKGKLTKQDLDKAFEAAREDIHDKQVLSSFDVARMKLKTMNFVQASLVMNLINKELPKLQEQARARGFTTT